MISGDLPGNDHHLVLSAYLTDEVVQSDPDSLHKKVI